MSENIVTNDCFDVPYEYDYDDLFETKSELSEVFQSRFTSIAIHNIYDMNDFIFNKKVTISKVKNGSNDTYITLNFKKNNDKIDNGANFLNDKPNKLKGLTLSIYYLPKEINNKITSVKLETSYNCVDKWKINPMYNGKKIIYHEINNCINNVEPTEYIAGLNIKVPYYMPGVHFNPNDTNNYNQLFIKVSRINCLFDDYLGSFYINLDKDDIRKKNIMSNKNKNTAYDEIMNWVTNEQKKLETVVKNFKKVNEELPRIIKKKVIKIS